jgi:CRP-like cAMP-binding protein
VAAQDRKFFKTLTEQEEEAVLARCSVIEMSKGEILFRKGEQSTSMYIVSDGEFVVTDEKPAQKVYLSSIRAGGLIGEMSFLDESPRSATVTAKERSVAYRMNKEDFVRTLLEAPALGSRLLLAIAILLVDRLRKADAALTSLTLAPSRSGDETGLAKAVESGRGS